MYIDKQKAKRGAWRIPEKTIFIITALGGGIGTIAGMHTFRHKTQKLQLLAEDITQWIVTIVGNVLH